MLCLALGVVFVLSIGIKIHAVRDLLLFARLDVVFELAVIVLFLVDVVSAADDHEIEFALVDGLLDFFPVDVPVRKGAVLPYADVDPLEIAAGAGHFLTRVFEDPLLVLSHPVTRICRGLQRIFVLFDGVSHHRVLIHGHVFQFAVLIAPAVGAFFDDLIRIHIFLFLCAINDVTRKGCRHAEHHGQDPY